MIYEKNTLYALLIDTFFLFIDSVISY